MTFNRIENITYALSNINALLGSGVNYAQERKEGVSQGEAIFNMGLNTVNGVARNAVAHEMAQYGNYSGHLINGIFGYGNQEANSNATAGLMMANLPALFGFGYSMAGYPMMGGYPMGGGCCHTMPPPMGMFHSGGCTSSFFIQNRFYC